MLSLFLISLFVSGTIVGGIAVHGITDKGYGEGALSSLDRLILAWHSDRKDQREHEKSKLKFLDAHFDE